MHLSTGGSSSPGSMRDIEFRQVRSIEGLPDGGPRTQEQPASHTCPASSTTSPNFARTETSGHKAEELFCLWNVLSDLIAPPPNSVLPALPVAVRLHARCGRVLSSPPKWRTAACSSSEKSTAARIGEDHDLALCRYPACHGECGSRAPPQQSPPRFVPERRPRPAGDSHARLGHDRRWPYT
jgi:hypothetical protein